MKKEFICIVCPRGCHITVDDDGNIEGYGCIRGKKYVEEELEDPRRIVTSTVKTVFPDRPRISCKTSEPVPKGKIFDVMEAIDAVTVDEELAIGDTVIHNVCDTGADIVLTKAVKPRTSVK
jgi:CxxC motif-containing protein